MVYITLNCGLLRYDVWTIGWKSSYFEECDDVQSNQKMHDLYATKHISEMVFPDAFWAVCSQIFS